MSKRDDFVNKALSWLGTKEGSKGHRQLVSDYNKACDKGRKADASTPWCALFIGAVAQETDNVLKDGIGVPVDCSCGTGSHSLMEKAKACGTWVENDGYNPIVGDIIIYDWKDSGKGEDTTGHDHTGIVTKAGNPFTVTEGNKSDSVSNRSVKVDAKFTRGFITPRFADEVNPPAPAPEPTPTPAPAPTPSTQNYKVKTNGSTLALRVAPNAKSSLILWMPNGSKVTVDRSQDGWMHTQYKGRWGWAYGKWMTKI